MSAEGYFNKKFRFKNEGYQLPKEEVFFSNKVESYQALQIIKSILNHVKSKLNEFKIEEWSMHTRTRNPAQGILIHLRNIIQAEFVTQAFCKFYECVSSYPLVPLQTENFLTIFLCEAPGAFITSLNHYLKLHHPDVEFQWRATTLNPYFEGNPVNQTILDDRLISRTLENWYFGEDYDGDILKESNMKSLIEYCRQLGPIQFVTSDGSIDCLDHPDHQEEYVARLHIAEFVVSLAILANDGSMLIKMFTFFESSSICMLYILNCCFKEVNIFKPVTSKEGNSEVYVICLGYKKEAISDEIIQKIINNFKDDSKAILPLDIIPKEFLNQVSSAARWFMNQQVAVIEGNIRNFKKYDRSEIERIKMMKHQLTTEFIKRYEIRPIADELKLLHGLKVNNDVNLNVRVHSGSHNERMIFQNLTTDDQMTVLYDRLKHFYDSIAQSPMAHCGSIVLTTELQPSAFIKLIRGKAITKVVSSKFILVSLIRYFVELRSFLEQLPNYSGSYVGNKFIINQNQLTIEMEYFRRASCYDTYEKDVVNKILNFILEQKSDEIIIESLPLFTQFLVGVITFLALFVFNEIQLKRNSGIIQFTSIRPNGRDNLIYLHEILTTNHLQSSAILGICDTKLLFSLDANFYKSIIDYNNHLSLKLSSFYLNICNNS